MNIKAILIITILIILVSLQYTLNKILCELKEIKLLIKNRFQ